VSSNLAYHGSNGDYFANHADTGTWNRYVDRPTMLGLIGDVAGQRVLDAGCGAGHYAAALVQRGASVMGMEGSAVLVDHARARLDGQAEVLQHDLDTPLDPLDDATFDGVVCALVLHHLRNRPLFLREVFRVLRPGGWLALSTTHPTFDWKHFGDPYFSTDWVELKMRDGKHSIRYQRISLEVHIEELLTAGFVLDRLVESRPDETLREKNPEGFADLTRNPSLLALRLRRN
jgi:SAM-dependent methyltransferase